LRVYLWCRGSSQQQGSHHAAASWQVLAVAGTGWRACLPYDVVLRWEILGVHGRFSSVVHDDHASLHPRDPLLVEQASGISKQQAMRTKQQSAARVLMTRVIPVVKEG